MCAHMGRHYSHLRVEDFSLWLDTALWWFESLDHCYAEYIDGSVYNNGLWELCTLQMLGSVSHWFVSFCLSLTEDFEVCPCAASMMVAASSTSPYKASILFLQLSCYVTVCIYTHWQHYLMSLWLKRNHFFLKLMFACCIFIFSNFCYFDTLFFIFLSYFIFSRRMQWLA